MIITNTQGRVIFYNKAHAQIDEIEQDMMLGNIENDVLFGLDINTLCQTTKKPVKGFISPYYTIRGKEIDATYWVYPLFYQSEVVGAITRQMALHLGNWAEEIAKIKEGRAVAPQVVLAPTPKFTSSIPINLQAWDEVKTLVCDKEMDLICQALTATVGQVSLAARHLGISRQLLNYRMKKYGISRKAFKGDL